MTRITWTALLGLAVVVAMAVPAHAVVVTNTTTGQTIFNDNGFENEGLGTVTPTATVGTWSTAGPPNPGSVVNDDPPGGFKSSQFYRMNTGTASNTRVLHAVFDPAPLAGQTIRAVYMMRFLTDVKYDSSYGFARNLTNSGYHLTQAADKGTGILDPFGGAGAPDGSISRGAGGGWHKMTWEYTANVGNATLQVDDGPVLPWTGAAPNIPVSLHWTTAEDSVKDFGIDAFPEPATLSLLGLGGLMILRRRRRVA